MRPVAATLTHPGEAEWDAPAQGFRRWEGTVMIGAGADLWRRTSIETLRWGVKTRSGFSVAPAEKATVGSRPIITARAFGISIREPVEVVDVVETPDRVGFAYRTLPGHPVAGEEAFILHREGDGVWLTIRSLTRPSLSLPWRLLYPALLVAQQIARRRYLRAFSARTHRCSFDRMGPTISAVAHADLTHDDLTGLRTLFDAEYLRAFGEWDPHQPYGYAPHDVHLIARDDGLIVGHAGWARREIDVGEGPVVVGGVGGVLVSDGARGHRLGEQLMSGCVASMRDAGGVDFGYLGCREEVVPFYRSCGWTRVEAVERSIDRAGHPCIDPPGQPLLIFPLQPSRGWPDGEIDLKGRAW